MLGFMARRCASSLAANLPATRVPARPPASPWALRPPCARAAEGTHALPRGGAHARAQAPTARAFAAGAPAAGPGRAAARTAGLAPPARAAAGAAAPARAGAQQAQTVRRAFAADAAKEAAREAAKEAAAPAENLSLMQRYPFAANILIATLKTSFADLIAQCAVEQKSLGEVDWKRNMVFVVFGAVYLGGVQYWIQVNMYKVWFPTMQRFASHPTLAAKLKDTAGQIDVVKQIAFDVVVHLPFMYLPCFMVVKEFVQGKTWNPLDWVSDASKKYVNNFASDVKTMTMVWLPADVVIFSVPLYLRLPVRHIVSLAWTAYLSFLRGAATK